MQTDKLYIDGAWVPSDRHRHASTCTTRATASVIGSIPEGTADDVDKAAKAARAAFAGWSQTSAEERAKFCTRIAEGLGARMDEIATVVSREAGHAEVAEPDRAGRPADQLLQHGRHDRRELRLRGDDRQQPRREGARRRRRLPSRRGTTRCTRSRPRSPTPSPPAAPSCSSRARSLRSTPSSSPRSSTTSACPPACSTSSPAPARWSARPSSPTPRSTWCSFTGSTRAGKRIAEVASQSLKRVALELGGKSANILLDDLDDEGFEKYVRDGIGKCYLNSGQTCTALTRMLVPRARLADAERIAADEVETKFQPQDPFADFAMLGPLLQPRPGRPGHRVTSRRASTAAPSSSPAGRRSPRASTPTGSSCARRSSARSPTT